MYKLPRSSCNYLAREICPRANKHYRRYHVSCTIPKHYFRLLNFTSTHDRDFADAVAAELIVLRNHVLKSFTGNLTSYERERLKHTKYMSRMKAAVETKTKHMESTIASNISSAKRSGDDKKLKQAASRKKKFQERSGLEVSAKGGRFKLNRDLAGYHTTMRDEIEVPKMDPQIKLVMPKHPPDLRFPGALVSMEGVSFAYPKEKTYTLFDVNLIIHPGERVGLNGLNGAGKSTLVKLLAGDASSSSALNPSKGLCRVIRGHESNASRNTRSKNLKSKEPKSPKSRLSRTSWVLSRTHLPKQKREPS